MNPWQRNKEERILKATRMRIKELTRNEKGSLPYTDGKLILEIINVEALKGYKKKNLRLNNQKQ